MQRAINAVVGVRATPKDPKLQPPPYNFQQSTTLDLERENSELACIKYFRALFEEGPKTSIDLNDVVK